MRNVFLVLIGLVLLFLVAVPVWNKYFRKQVYLVLDNAGPDTNQCDGCANGCISETPSCLPVIEQIAAKYGAQVASVDEIGAAAAAGASWSAWGWAAAGTAYVPTIPVPLNGYRGAELLATLGCSSDTTLVNPCTASVVPGSPACQSTLSYQYDSASTDVSCTDPSCVPTSTVKCGSAGFVVDKSRLQESGCYVYNASQIGVVLYGVKPQGAVPFNSDAYSQYSAFSL